METTQEDYVEVYEDFIEKLIHEQAMVVMEINGLVKALQKHNRDKLKYNLKYYYDDETGVYSYIKISIKRIGFIGGKSCQNEERNLERLY